MRTHQEFPPSDWIRERIVYTQGTSDLTAAARKLIMINKWSGKAESLRKALNRFPNSKRKLMIANFAGYDSVASMTDAWRASCSVDSVNNSASIEELNALAKWADSSERYEEAKGYLLKLLEAAGSSPTQERANLLRQIAKQHMYLGNFKDALLRYAEAKECFHSCDDAPGDVFVTLILKDIDFHEKKIEWFKSGNSMVYLDYIKKFSAILETYANGNGNSLRLQSRLLHLRRQEAEILRNVGRYNEAAAMAEQLEEDYAKLHMGGEEAAWARVIWLDAKRMACDLRDREEVSKLIEGFSWMHRVAECHGWRRMLARVRKGYYDLSSAFSQNPRWKGEAPELGSYFFACVSGYLVNARHRLCKEPETEAAMKLFRQAYELTRSRGGGVHLESAIAEFGIAEAHRKRSKRRNDPSFKQASQLYSKLVSRFTSLGCSWGIVRSLVALHLMRVDFNDYTITHEFQGADATLFGLLSSPPKPQHSNLVLFDRLP